MKHFQGQAINYDLTYLTVNLVRSKEVQYGVTDNTTLSAAAAYRLKQYLKK